jgi:SWI/SNF-related matrix-associated actin-dependent regulator of chromatin subfamily A-like protein 1
MNAKRRTCKTLKMAYLRKTMEGDLIIIVKFPFNIPDLEAVKSIPGRKYTVTAKNKDKYWTVPVNDTSLKILKKECWMFDEVLLNYLKYATSEANKAEESLNLNNLPGKLYPFQEQGVRQLIKWRGRALIGDDMGLGKTVQALTWLRLNPKAFPAVILVPASLKLNWKKEAEKWLETSDIEVLSGTKDYPLSAKLIIINYDILSAWLDTLLMYGVKTVVLDEAHYIKNSAALRTKAAKRLAKGCQHVIAMSGTAVVNRPIEIFNAIALVHPGLMPSRWKFAHRYCGAKHNGFGWDFSGASNIEELHQFLKEHIMIRRRKIDVLTELPDKTYTTIPLEINNRYEYQQAEDDFISYVRGTTMVQLIKMEDELRKTLDYVDGDILSKEALVQQKINRIEGAETLVKIEALKQLAVEGILSQVFDWIDDFIESGEKLIVFAVHRKVIDALMQRYGKKAVKVEGSVSITARQVAVESFQNDKKIQLFIGNIKAAGVGLTLTAASNVAFIEYPWAPGDMEQAEDRAHRIGQKNNVQIHRFVAVNTVVEKIIALIDEKKKVVQAVLDGIVDTSNSGVLKDLLRQYK